MREGGSQGPDTSPRPTTETPVGQRSNQPSEPANDQYPPDLKPYQFSPASCPRPLPTRTRKKSSILALLVKSDLPAPFSPPPPSTPSLPSLASPPHSFFCRSIQHVSRAKGSYLAGSGDTQSLRQP